jgi:hypothetical protein
MLNMTVVRFENVLDAPSSLEAVSSVPTFTELVAPAW